MQYEHWVKVGGERRLPLLGLFLNVRQHYLCVCMTKQVTATWGSAVWGFYRMCVWEGVSVGVGPTVSLD